VTLEFDHRLTVDTCRRLMLGRSPWDRLGFTIDDVDRIATLPPDGEVIAARDGDVVVGIAVLGGSMLLGGYLRLLAVDAGHRRLGIGRRLLNAFEGVVFSRWPNAYLCVSDFNVDARDFYRGAGYSEVGRLPDLLVEGLGEVLMRKSIGAWRTFDARSGG
jgi:ribosomal protein S18 acetylase RimI-like enzyme